MNLPRENDPELDALLGAYALDALEPDEREMVDAYIARNPIARDEVDELRESAASLALAPVDDTTVPAGLWERISHTIEEESPPARSGVAGTAIVTATVSSTGNVDELAVRRSIRRTKWISGIAVAASVAAVVLAAQVISLHGQLNDRSGTGEQAAAAGFTRAGHVQGARQVALTPAQGAEVARVVLLPDGNGYLKSDGLTPLGADQTYQLWALTGNTDHPIAISAGVLGPHPVAAAFRTTTDVKGFAITIEQAGGVAQSTQTPYASASMA